MSLFADGVIFVATFGFLFNAYRCGNEIHLPGLPIRIVEEPTSYIGVPQVGNVQAGHDQMEALTMRVKPSPRSGPAHLVKALAGKCFSTTDETYRYEFCPFSNVTQYEQSFRWNPYSGILGVWQEWEIENNTFTAMMLRDGDSCADHYRSVKVLLGCGHRNEIVNVSEPTTCAYELFFSTPLVCHPHARLVYPTLNASLRHDWDVIEARRADLQITSQGYRKSLHRLFEKAGYQLSEERKSSISDAAVKRESLTKLEANGEFDSLSRCTQEYKKLQVEIQTLRTLLELHQIHTNTSDVHG